MLTTLEEFSQQKKNSHDTIKILITTKNSYNKTKQKYYHDRTG